MSTVRQQRLGIKTIRETKFLYYERRVKAGDILHSPWTLWQRCTFVVEGFREVYTRISNLTLMELQSTLAKTDVVGMLPDGRVVVVSPETYIYVRSSQKEHLEYPFD